MAHSDRTQLLQAERRARRSLHLARLLWCAALLASFGAAALCGLQLAADLDGQWHRVGNLTFDLDSVPLGSYAAAVVLLLGAALLPATLLKDSLARALRGVRQRWADAERGPFRDAMVDAPEPAEVRVERFAEHFLRELSLGLGLRLLLLPLAGALVFASEREPWALRLTMAGNGLGLCLLCALVVALRLPTRRRAFGVARVTS